jgi:nucleoside-diphosphate-sugar epimerase
VARRRVQGGGARLTRLAAVTGATGFLGRHIVQALQADGWQVRALARRDTALACDVVRGDLADRVALQRLCAGADVVVHCAGLVKARTRADFDAVNVEGARRVAEAGASVPRVVLVSSLVAREPQLSAYAASKRGGEAAMTALLGRRLTIARPPAIYGPGDRELLPVFRAAAASPVLPVFDPAARIAMVHVEDAARQVAALAAGAAPARTVALADSRPGGYGWAELMQTAARACGRSPSLAPLPGAIVRLIGITNDFAALLGKAPMLTSGKARELLHPNWSVGPEELLEALPRPKYTLEDGFASTVNWYRSAAWMKQ